MMYIYAIPYQSKYIVYCPLKHLAFIANAALVNLIFKISANPFFSQKNGHENASQFLESIGFWKPEPPAPFAPVPDEPFKPTIAVLFLTTACNFRCIYCYASGGEGTSQYLSFERGCRAIDAVCQNALSVGQDYFELGFHGGGEPTLARENFRKLIEYARTKELPCHITVASHGFWNADERDWNLDHLDGLSLSFDGIRDVQNRQRPLVSGQGSFQTVMETIKAMDQRNFPYGIRMTVTDESINSLARSLEFLCKETSCQTFQVEPAFDHGRATYNQTALRQNERFAAAFLEAYDVAVSSGRHLYYSGARPWAMTSRFCQAPERALVVTPLGALSACYEIYDENHSLSHDFLLGHLSENGDLDIDLAARKKFLKKLQERRSLCEDCFCYWHCAGDCPAKTFTTDNDGHLRFGERCELNRLITKELLIRYISDGDGIWQGTEY